MFAEIVLLVRAVIWPTVFAGFVIFYRKEVREILNEIPLLLRRLVSGKALGIEVRLSELIVAEQEAPHLELPIGEVPPAPTEIGR